MTLPSGADTPGAVARVVLAGGGTAGHIEPALALGDELRARHPNWLVSALGTTRGLETTLAPARGYELDLVPAVPFPRRVSPRLLAVPLNLLRAVRATGRVLVARRADVVVGFGGYVSVPAYLAARRRGVAVVVHEANAMPGLANRIGARFARAVATGYPDTPLPRTTHTGTPLRAVIAGLDRAALRDDARALFGLQPGFPTLLAFGGSQGARRINEAMVAAAPALCSAGVQVLHATGASHADHVRAAIGSRGPGDPAYIVVPYLDRMELAYAAADLALCRAGAMTCAELTAVGLPAVFVPLPHGNGEQRLNAQAVVAAGGGLEVDDARLGGDWIADHVPPLLSASGRLAEMAAAARRLGRPDAAARLADVVVRVATETRAPARRRSRGAARGRPAR